MNFALTEAGIDTVPTATLRPTLVTRYHRSTLFVPEGSSRATIDTALSRTDSDGRSIATPGLDSNGTAQITGGTVTVNGPTSDGTVLATFELSKNFSSIVYSSSDIEDGTEHSFVVDGTSVTTAIGGVALAGGMGGGGGGPGGDGDR